MSDWFENQLGELGQTFSGLSGKNKEDFGSGRPYIPYLNIFSNTKINPHDLDFVQIKPTESQNKVQLGDIFFTTSSETLAEVGMTSVLLHDLDEAYLNSFCFGFRLHNFDTLLPEFAAYLLRSENVRRQIIFNGQGSTRYNLSKTQLLKNVVLNIPPKQDQQVIAEIFDTIEGAIEQTRRLIAKYERIKIGLMQDLLTRGIDKQGNIRSEQKHEFQESPLGKIPVEWEVVTLNSVIDKSTVITYGIVQTGVHVPEGIRVLRTVDLSQEGIDESKLLRTSEEISNRYKRTILKSGDIVCNVRATVGDFNIVPPSLEGANTTRGVARISPRQEIYNHYLLWFLKSEANRRQIELQIKGTTFIELNIADLRELLVPVPPTTEEQIEIAETLNSIQSFINCEKLGLSKLESQKTALMQDLLTGKVRVDTLTQQTAQIV